MPLTFRRIAWMIALGSLGLDWSGCGSSLSGSDGAAGTTGMGATSGTTGMGGTGGSEDAGPMCMTPAVLFQTCVFEGQSSAVTSTISAAVTVTSVDTIASGTCPTTGIPVLDPTLRLVLQGPSQQWTVYLHLPELPADLVRAGDALDLSVTPYNVPTVLLARGGSLVAFASSYSGFMAPPLPDLSRFGIALSDGGVTCTSMIGDCRLQGHRVHVTTAAASGDVERGQTAQIGGLSISVESYNFVQCFDPNQTMEMAGFVIP